MILRSIAMTGLVMSIAMSAHGANYCGELTSSFGPFDYSSPLGQKNRRLVENAHFTPDVEHLTRPNAASIAADLSYTLAVFPNHHRALASMATLGIRENTPQPKRARFSVDCYFERAMRFKPDDGVVRMVYGSYLAKRGQLDNAIAQLKEAVALEPENVTINYNLGLLYLKAKDYDQANTYAKKAYALGFPLPWLKDRLVEAGKWKDE